MRSLSTIESIESLLDDLVFSEEDDQADMNLVRVRLLILSYVLSAVARQVQSEGLFSLSSDLEKISRSLSFGRYSRYHGSDTESGSDSERYRFLRGLYKYLAKLSDYLEVLSSLSLSPKDRERYDEALRRLSQSMTGLKRALSRSHSLPQPYSDIDLTRVSGAVRSMTKLARTLRDCLFSYEEFVA